MCYTRTGGSRLWSTWWGLWRISAKSLESVASQSSIIVGWVGDSKPCFFIFVSRAWRRCLQPSPSIPHQAGLAYTILDTMVALVTSHPSPHHSCGIYFLATSDSSTMNINFSGRDLKTHYMQQSVLRHWGSMSPVWTLLLLLLANDNGALLVQVGIFWCT